MDTTRTNSSSPLAAYFRDPENAQDAVEDLSEAGIQKRNIGVVVSERDSKWADKIGDMFEPEERHDYAGADGLAILSEMGLTDSEARSFERELRNGGALMTVTPESSRREDAISILRSHDGILSGDGQFSAIPPITETSEMEPATEQIASGEPHRMQLLGEVLRVDKQRFDREPVNIRKEVVEEQQTVEVPVTREELVVERHPATGSEMPRSEVGADAGKDIRIPLSEERVEVEKRPVVREELEIGKKQIEEQKEVSGTVRHEEARIDNPEGERRDLNEKGPKAA
jgi:uncharacterized protein (TIGR02271 family)